MHWKENRIKSAKNDTNPMVIKELKGSYVVLEMFSFFQVIVYYFLKER